MSVDIYNVLGRLIVCAFNSNPVVHKLLEAALRNQIRHGVKILHLIPHQLIYGGVVLLQRCSQRTKISDNASIFVRFEFFIPLKLRRFMITLKEPFGDSD